MTPARGRLGLLLAASAVTSIAVGVAMGRGFDAGEQTTGLGGINWNVLAPVLVTIITGAVLTAITLVSNNHAKRGADSAVANAVTMNKVESSVNGAHAQLLADVKAEQALAAAEIKKLREEVSRLTVDKAATVAADKATLIEKVRVAEEKKP